MVKRHDVTQIPVEQVQVGFSPLMPPAQEGQPPWAFQVNSVKFSFKEGSGSMYTLKSTPHVETGEPVVLELPMGSIVTRVVRTYDDGT